MIDSISGGQIFVICCLRQRNTVTFNDGNMLLIRIYNVNFVAQYINAQKGYTQFILGDVMT